jgi:hypothetical protein
MKAINSDVAVHDNGFQFYLFLKVKNEINSLIKDLKVVEECIKYHKESKKNTWYDSKTKLHCFGSIEGYLYNSVFTLKEINFIYKEKKSKYDFLIGIAEDSLSSAKKSYENDKTWRVPSGAIDRSDILIDHIDIDDF